MNGPTINKNESDNEPEGEILYQGNAVPKVLRVAYGVFIVFLTVYVSKFLIPDLVGWLKK
ncbi:MAG: hypothetical protein IPJ69_11430 [Deltaproteobacteria bacterium]|nr:MAG: hypothetical protein IPJ69_11430 [Deltaproteobacteria bacterium]